MTASPYFSVVIPTYNRAGEVRRCLDSCFAQTLSDFEAVVVDDASTDATSATLAAIDDPRLRVVRHDRNRGISPARATGVRAARGEWLVLVDSDWELVPHALMRLRELIDGRPDAVGVIRSRLRGDDGTLQPAILPAGVTDYRGRLEWCDAVAAADASADAGQCLHRSVREIDDRTADRRGGVETLWELDVARRVASLWVPDVLGIQHVDAANSHTRDLDPGRLIPRLLAEAGDVLWVEETLLRDHREGLERYAPHYRHSIRKNAAVQAFLAGDRRRGVRHTVAALRDRSWRAPAVLAALVLGLLGPRPLARAQLANRRRRSGR